MVNSKPREGTPQCTFDVQARILHTFCSSRPAVRQFAIIPDFIVIPRLHS